MESGRQTGQGYDCREKQHLLESGAEAEGEAGAEGDSETGQIAVPSSTQGRLRRAPRTQNRSKMNTVGKLTVSNIETHQPAAVTRTVQTHTLLSDHRQNPERDPHKYPRLVCETLTAFTAVKYTQCLSF